MLLTIFAIFSFIVISLGFVLLIVHYSNRDSSEGTSNFLSKRLERGGKGLVSLAVLFLLADNLFQLPRTERSWLLLSAFALGFFLILIAPTTFFLNAIKIIAMTIRRTSITPFIERISLGITTLCFVIGTALIVDSLILFGWIFIFKL